MWLVGIAFQAIMEHAQVGTDALRTLHYIPDFISLDEEQRLLTEVHSSQTSWVQVTQQWASCQEQVPDNSSRQE